jgi:hypothetical protein
VELGGYPAGVTTQNVSVEIPKAQTQQFLEKLEKAKFWTLPTEGPPGGLDGAQWIMEGTQNGMYHVADRWSPRKDEYASACLYLLHLSKIRVEARDVY